MVANSRVWGRGLLLLLATAGCTVKEPNLECRSHEDCPRSADFCIEARDIALDECRRGERATNTTCASSHSGLVGCVCVVGRAPFGFDGGTPGSREGHACFESSVRDAGSASDSGVRPLDLLPGESALLQAILVEDFWVDVRATEGADVSLVRARLLGFETHAYLETGLTDRALLWVEFRQANSLRFAFADVYSEPGNCNYTWTAATDTEWRPWTSFSSPPTQLQTSVFLEPFYAFGRDPMHLRAALRLEERWQHLLGFPPPFQYPVELPVPTLLECH